MDYEGDAELVTLGECDSESEFQIVRGLLESEGIECFSPNHLPYSYEKGMDRRGLALQVRQEDEARARAILDAPVELPAERDLP